MPQDEFDTMARARKLFRHRESGSVFAVPLITESPADMGAAYAVQDALDAIFSAANGAITRSDTKSPVPIRRRAPIFRSTPRFLAVFMTE